MSAYRATMFGEPYEPLLMAILRILRAAIKGVRIIYRPDWGEHEAQFISVRVPYVLNYRRDKFSFILYASVLNVRDNQRRT